MTYPTPSGCSKCGAPVDKMADDGLCFYCGIVADQTIETPEALAERIESECHHESTCGFATCGAHFDQEQAAALIAQHTAELTARIAELERHNAQIQESWKLEEEAHTRTAQREASARAEAREAALREAKAAVVALYRYDESQPDTDAAVEAIRALLTSSPPPRVDAWIPVSELLPPVAEWVLVANADRIVQRVAWRLLDTGWWESDLEEYDCVRQRVFAYWQPLPPPPSAEPAKGGPDAG